MGLLRFTWLVQSGILQVRLRGRLELRARDDFKGIDWAICQLCHRLFEHRIGVSFLLGFAPFLEKGFGLDSFATLIQELVQGVETRVVHRRKSLSVCAVRNIAYFLRGKVYGLLIYTQWLMAWALLLCMGLDLRLYYSSVGLRVKSRWNWILCSFFLWLARSAVAVPRLEVILQPRVALSGDFRGWRDTLVIGLLRLVCLQYLLSSLAQIGIGSLQVLRRLLLLVSTKLLVPHLVLVHVQLHPVSVSLRTAAVLRRTVVVAHQLGCLPWA